MNKIFFVLLAMLTIGTVSGCASFRKVFSVKDPSLERGSRPQVKHKKNSYKSRAKSSDDPLFDKVFQKSRAERSRPVNSSVLNAREQQLINDVRNADDGTFSAIKERNRSSLQKQSDWVYGTKNGKYFEQR